MLHTIPKEDGYYMPGEFEPHRGCIMIWPQRPGSWIYGAVAARQAFREVIGAIAQSEHVYVAAGAAGIASARSMLAEIPNVTIWEIETDDAWARDIAPTFVKTSGGPPRCVNWEFNAWGGTYNGLYASWKKDNAFAKAFADEYGYEIYEAAPFVLEGGSVHSDGEGTLLVTESCLLSRGRNPLLTKEQIEQRLCSYLGAEKVIWLPRGIYNDETDEHVDNVCAFLKPGEVVLAWTDCKNDPQYPMSDSCLKVLEQECDARGRRFVVHKLPVPDIPVCVTQEELEGYTFEEGEDVREAGERLAASYVNFYFSNDAVIMPVFGGANEESDRRAVQLMQEWCPQRRIIAVPAGAILEGGGNIHCITQQIPV